jgi:predicted membrane-bound spermidine synthase
MPKKPLYSEIFATSLGALLLEIAYTRIFSFKVVYYFTYLILGLGLLGVGAGGIVTATSRRVRETPPEELVPVAGILGGAAVFFGYRVISPLRLDIANAPGDPLEIAKVLLVCVLLTLPFFAVGIIVSTILGSRPDAAQRLYGADLIGAALGCAVAVPLVAWLTPPRTIMLAGLFLALAGARLARLQSRQVFITSLLVALGLFVPLATGVGLRDPKVAHAKQFEDFRREKTVLFSEWSPVFRIDVAQHPFFPDELKLVFHDGQPGSGLHHFDGDFRRFDYLLKDARALPFDVLPKGPRVLVIGAAGGHELVTSLYFGASHVTGVELNPVTYSLLTTHFADFTGHLAENPKVTLVNGDGRWFLKQSKEQYDLVWLVAPDSYAAMNAATSGAFVLSESYLYTVEMMRAALAHLSDEGVVCAQFGERDLENKPNRTTRYIATARAAFAEVGIPDFRQHVLVASVPGFPPYREPAVLLGKSAFGPEQLRAFDARVKRLDEGMVHYRAGDEPGASRVSQIAALPAAQLPEFFAKSRYQVDPVRDDAPFFWHFTRFRDAFAAPLPTKGVIVDHEDSVAERITLSFLGIVAVLAALALFLPLLTIRESFTRMPKKSVAAVYFASLGVGFMFVEVALIQKLTLLLGYPTYSLSVTLAALLVFSGIGSIQVSRWGANRNRALWVVLAVLGFLILGVQTLLPALIDAVIGYNLAIRIALTVAIVAPIGVCLGAFMPLGLQALSAVSAVSRFGREYVAWAWAVNGFFSVIASILSTILAMVFGFRWLFAVALLVYAAGVAVMSRFPSGTEAS